MKKTLMKSIYRNIALSLLLTAILLFAGCSNSENERTVLWKFQNFKKLSYNLTQNTKVSPATGIFAAFGITNKATGKLTITPTSENTADIDLKDLNMGENGELLLQNLKKDNGELPDIFIKGLKTDGTIEGKISEAMQLFYTGVLPVPTKDLAVGESVVLPIKMPMKAFGLPVTMKGTQTLTLKSIKKNLYKFENDILINQVAEGSAQEPQEIKGKGNYIFDVEKGYFTEAEVELKTKIKMSDLQKNAASNENMPFKIDFNDMIMNFTSAITLDLDKVE